MGPFIKNCTGIILAGGENTRMPVLKAFIEVEGRKIIERNLGIYNDLFRDVFIVTNQPDAYSGLGAPMLGDTYNTRGPMSGIFTALLNSRDHWIFVSACDMPFISEDLIKYMAAQRTKKYAAVVPRLMNKTEPLFAFYSQNLLGPMEKAVRTGRKSLRDFLHNKRVQYITAGEIRKIDPRASSFINLNSPDDVDQHLLIRDKARFKRMLERRKTCLV